MYLQRTWFHSQAPVWVWGRWSDLSGHRRGNTCLPSRSFSSQLQVSGGKLAVRRVCCDKVKAEREGCVLGSLCVFLSIGTSAFRDTWASFSNCSLDHGFSCSWVFTRLGPGNTQPSLSGQLPGWPPIAVGYGDRVTLSLDFFSLGHEVEAGSGRKAGRYFSWRDEILLYRHNSWPLVHFFFLNLRSCLLYLFIFIFSN